LLVFADVNECLQPDACLNDGICRNLVGSYRCECREGWEGDRCERGKETQLYNLYHRVPFY